MGGCVKERAISEMPEAASGAWYSGIMKTLQEAIEAKGKEIFRLVEGERPRVFSRRNLTGRLLAWSMRDERLKVQLFRLVDVLPSLKRSGDVLGHAEEYLLGDGTVLPAALRWLMRLGRGFPWLAGPIARAGVRRMADTFILAGDASEAIPKIEAMRSGRIAFTVDLLGETAVSEREAEEYQRRYLELIECLALETARWETIPQIDCDERGPMPKANVSVKISALNSQIQAVDPEGALGTLSLRLRPLMRRAHDLGVFVNLDMEHVGLKDVTFELFKRLLDEPGLRGSANWGIAVQAYLKESERDLRSLIEWARKEDRVITVRLIKGAYWDYETVMARQRGWPVPVFESKAETDANYERLAGVILENGRWIRAAFGTHNIRSIASCLTQAEQRGIPRSAIEIQMLYGMAEPIKRALVAMGYRVRDYCPVGEMLPGMAYLVRRLLENTSNESFLRHAFLDAVGLDELLKDPGAKADDARSGRMSMAFGSGAVAVAAGEAAAVARFQNEPLTDFTRAEKRAEMESALRVVRSHLGKRSALVIEGKEVWTSAVIESINPARPSEVVGSVARGTPAEAERAVASGKAAFEKWKRTGAEERAGLLERVADLLQRDRFALAALEVFETGKIWTESDADVAEAIDFCRFYAGETRRLSGGNYPVPGESNVHQYVPRGLGVVIAPWNFPLAILCGMTMAAVGAGNCVILKPSEQSSVVAAQFMRLLMEAGIPAGVVNLLPGRGEEVGEYLVRHAGIDFVAFTGSREVGLKIWETAGRTLPGQRHLKKVICEMGGKNAVIIDSDADLDEAIPGVIASAFGYQGQKCSALSRLIVLAENHDRVVERLIEGCRSLRLGPPEDPASRMGPVIDQAAFERIRNYIQIGKEEGRLAYSGEALGLSEGYYVPPAIFVEVPPDARIAQEEIFGPVLAVMRARDLDEALRWANGTAYALTGGLYSRSPSNIERVKREFEVGNLYINRGITGALVGRQPFGGFKMSGGGTKAGGSDYLQQFMFPRVVTENQMRRGFTPDS